MYLNGPSFRPGTGRYVRPLISASGSYQHATPRYAYNDPACYVGGQFAPGYDRSTTYVTGTVGAGGYSSGQKSQSLPPRLDPLDVYMRNDNLAAHFQANTQIGSSGDDTVDIKSVDADSINDTLLVLRSTKAAAAAAAAAKPYKSILKPTAAGITAKVKTRNSLYEHFLSRRKKNQPHQASFGNSLLNAKSIVKLPVVNASNKPKLNKYKVSVEYSSPSSSSSKQNASSLVGNRGSNPSHVNSNTRLIPLAKPGNRSIQHRDMPISSGFGGYTNTTRRKPAPKPQPVKQEITMAPRKPVKVQPLYRVNSDEDLFRPKTIIVEDEPEEEVVHVVHRQRPKPKEKIIYVEEEAPQPQTNVVYVERPASPQVIYQKAQSPQVIFSQPPAPLVIQQPTPQIVYANAQPRQQMATAPQQIVYMNEPPVQYVYQAPEQPFAQNIGGQQVSYFEQNPLVYVNDQIPIANANVVTTVPSSMFYL